MKIPREHGLYVVLVSCWLIGYFYASVHRMLPLLATIAVGLCTVLSFGVARDVVRYGLRDRRRVRRSDVWVASVLLFGALSTGTYLIIDTPMQILFAAGMLCCSAWYLTSYRTRGDLISQSFVGFLGATILIPSTALAADPRPSLLPLLIYWASAMAYFWASIFAVKIRMHGSQMLRGAAIYHTIATVVLAVPLVIGLAGPEVLVPIGIAWVRLLVISLSTDRWESLPLKRVGLIESAVAGVVVAAMALLFQ